jgi:DNA-binding response OmpR family regulator
MIVENDKAVREVLRVSLTRAGYDVIQAEDGEKALGLVNDADVVVLDLVLPKLNGEEFLRCIRGSGNYIPVVVTSGVYPKEEVEKNLRGLEVVDFVPKPFSIKEIVEKVAKGLEIAKCMSGIRHSTDRIQGFIARQAMAAAPRAGKMKA